MRDVVDYPQINIPTTLQPVFAFPFDATSTVYASTTTLSSLVDCQGSVLVVSTYSAIIEATNGLDQHAGNDKHSDCDFSTYDINLICMCSDRPTAVPPPRINATAQALIDEIRTVILYASLIGNDGNLPKLCSVINPSALKNETGINGTAVLNEVCGAASIAVYDPRIAEQVVLENQLGVQYLYTALYAVEVLAGFGGGTNRTTLCNEIDENLLNNLFIAYVNGTATDIKRFVCGTG
ncbi:MAG: hypothetical protein LQ350_007501 [Teloschistes chrysophthalmus]|nr:MAG: hypothetical protein LQ350_007501 [Niorma chrysophthalma]